jgi:hypothetical protein
MKTARGLLMLMSAAALSCGGGDEGDLPFALVATCLRYPQSAEITFRSNAEWQEANGGYGKDAAPAVDFTRSMLAARFDGPGSACTSFSVDKVSLQDGRVTVRATRHATTQPCILIVAYPQVVVSIPRREEPVRFVIDSATGASDAPAKACY